MTFDKFFEKATEIKEGPYPFQQKFAKAKNLHQLVCVPTGMGKTAMTVLGWLWRRFHANDAICEATPRRLVYCLPMRVLVEQTAENAEKWVQNLCDVACLPKEVPVHVLMGGEEADDWDLYPEKEAIIVGTQDMLLSRALNRGYAASRARWPMHFGLLNNDCLWVFDEIQLMGPGLATTTQLEAFRHFLGSKDGHGCQTAWMSATLERQWLETVDFKKRAPGLLSLQLGQEDRQKAKSRWNAKKPLNRARACMGDIEVLVSEIRKTHKPGTRTIAIVNTVKRACELYQELCKNNLQPILLHSRFRPGDRKIEVSRALADPPPEGTIIVSTQVIEAGVDISAATLFTEVAPWASLVQRFGRCNRCGRDDDQAQVFWIDLPKGKKERARIAAPYTPDELVGAAKRLRDLRDVGLQSLPRLSLTFEHAHVLRRKDLIDLFDTTPDLAGNDIDIDRFIRDVEATDVRVFWRDWDQPRKNDPPPDDMPAPQRSELCSAPIGSKVSPGFRQFVEKRDGKVFRWNFLDKCWERVDVTKITPGQVYLVQVDAGGYTQGRGWNPDSKETVETIVIPDKVPIPDANDNDVYSRISVWQTIGQHTDEVCRELENILSELRIFEAEALRHASRWHDRGKVHEVFQHAIDDGQRDERRDIARRERPENWQGCRIVAKAPDKAWKNGEIVDPGWWRRYDWPKGGRRHFRHELAAALAVLDPSNQQVPDALRDLVAYLIAAHHGKVRVSIRSMPNEKNPRDEDGKLQPQRHFARGIWDGDVLPETDLGSGIVAPAVRLSLEPMELGLCEREPFEGQPSWAERMIRLRDRLGPFRLAYLEALLRVADWRASQREDDS